MKNTCKELDELRNKSFLNLVYSIYRSKVMEERMSEKDAPVESLMAKLESFTKEESQGHGHHKFSKC